MKASTRKRIGAGIFGASLIVGLFLYWLGVPLVSLLESHTHTFANGQVTAARYHMHLPLVALLLTAFLGFYLFIIPPKKKLPPKIAPESKA